MAQNSAGKVLQYKEHFKREAEDLLLNGFPATILKLNTILSTAQFQKRDFSNIHESIQPVGDCGPRKRQRCDPTSSRRDTFASNRHLTQLIETVKPHMIKLVEEAKIIKMWILYMIPKTEVGNSSGVEIQEEALVLVHAVETCAESFYEKITLYFNARGGIVKNLMKNPEIEDFVKAIQELDEKEYVSFCMIMGDIRNHYCALHDIFLKNLDKLKAPRSNEHVEAMY